MSPHRSRSDSLPPLAGRNKLAENRRAENAGGRDRLSADWVMTGSARSESIGVSVGGGRRQTDLYRRRHKVRRLVGVHIYGSEQCPCGTGNDALEKTTVEPYYLKNYFTCYWSRSLSTRHKWPPLLASANPKRVWPHFDLNQFETVPLMPTRHSAKTALWRSVFAQASYLQGIGGPRGGGSRQGALPG